LRRSRWILALTISLACPRTFSATPDQVQKSIESAKAFLYSQQKPDGTWELVPQRPTDDQIKTAQSDILGGQWGGLTALATYALLASGESPQSPKLAPAIKFLQSADIVGTYALGVKAQLYTLLPMTPELRIQAREDAAKLRAGMFTQGPAKGLYDYLLSSKLNTRFDHSGSQYGVLGTWAVERAGIEVPSSYWSIVEQAWIRDQDASGGWCYDRVPNPDHGITASMTAAGIATLFITQDYLHADNGVACRGNISNAHIDAGLKWMTDHFDQVLVDTKAPFQPYYALYGIERIGVASGLKYFGAINWFDTGADFLVKNQLPDGLWPGGVQSTSFALLFLSRGRAPLVMSKLQYDINKKEGNWNQRPRDAANLTHWIAKQTERDLNWQIVNLNASTSDLHDAPILYLSGNQALQFTADQQAKLKQFCEEGGLILGNADCSTTAFAASFRKLGTQLFPDYEFRELPANHPIFTNEQYPRAQWKIPPTVYALSNGVREMMVLMGSGDPAKYWQLQEYTGKEPMFQLAADAFLYAVDKQNLREKGKTYLVSPDSAITTDRDITLARLQYDGNWNPEPAGWIRMSAILHNASHINLKVQTIKLGANQLNGDIKIAHLTGTGKFHLTDTARSELKNFVTGGGTLIIDSAGGSEEFSQSAQAELTAIFGPLAAAQLSNPIPLTDGLFTLAGDEIKTIDYRPFTHKIVGNFNGPEIRAITISGRAAVYFSRLDLSAGLVGQPCDGIAGYTPDSAVAIMRNLLLAAGAAPKP
jgi:Domain of unknown function (DUF4159)